METVYFDSGGKQHTEKCLEIAKQHELLMLLALPKKMSNSFQRI